ncbi:putative ribonuclease H-like domain-containing protein [Tanacetum coccineum]|uniref:Ribonuclease H-like domain-containing protein n=1 Tax=Tanacetum coccineum TaxID=301880 RepID=A0ABQ4Z176_9ASTR
MSATEFEYIAASEAAMEAVWIRKIDQGLGSTSGIRACALRNFDLEVMELENTQNNALAKLPMLKLGEYEMWEIRIKQYFQIQDYALWEVIENGNSWVPIPVTTPSETGTSTATKMTMPSTIEEKTCKKNDVKARSLLLMALPNEHQLTFDQYVDAQSMFAAIKARFGGNEATKKTQKALLKQQYENFSASSSESLDSIFNRLQRLVSRLAILGVVTPPEDLNVKFLRSLPSEWDTHVVVWMNKPDFDTMGLDDLYNNFKIVEQKVKKSAGASNDDKNLAFVTTSGASSTNNINTVNPEVSTATTKVNTASTEISTASFSDATVYAFLSTQPKGSQLVHEDLEQLHDDDLEEMDLKWNMALLSMRARKFYQRTGRKIIIDGSNTAGYDKSKRIEIQANNGLFMAFIDFEVSNDKSCSKSCLQNYKALKKQYDDLLVKLGDTGFKASTYKRGLSILEGKIIKYKESEVLFSKEIALLKRSVGPYKNSNNLRSHLQISKTLMMFYVIFGGGANGGRITGKVTDDYSRFSWVFFLKTKDETTEILKNFINEIENLVDKKVKIIRSDNGTEFKNKVMDEFYREKEFSESSDNGTAASTKDLMGTNPTSEDTHVEDQKLNWGNISPSYQFLHSSYKNFTKIIPQLIRLPRTYIHVLFACIVLSKKNQERDFSKALKDPACGISNAGRNCPYILNCKMYGFLVDLPKGHRAIGTKRVTETIKDERVHTDKERYLYQSKINNVHEILRKSTTLDVKSCHHSHILEKPLVKDGDADDVNEYLYRSMIGSFEISTASRPDIMFAVCACARFQVSPKTSHLLAVKRIFRYLKGKPSLGLWYSKDSPLELVAYTDSDYAGATL